MAVAAMLVSATAAHADGYRIPMIATDVTVDATIGIGIGVEDGRLFGLGLVGYALGGPIVHLAEGNTGRAAGSLGIRVGSVFVFGLLGCLKGSASDDKGGGEPAMLPAGIGDCAVGAMIGMAIAQALDAAFLARGEDKTSPTMLTFGGRF